MRKRNRFTLFLMLPLAAFFSFFGWALYWIGSNQKWINQLNRDSHKELTFTVLMPKQKYAK